MHRTLTISIIAAAFASCAPLPDAAAPNPLDFPGTPQATAAELHLENLRAITSNPSYQAR